MSKRRRQGAAEQPRARWRPPRVPGKMNGTEREFELVLRARKQAGEVIEYEFEAFKLRYGDDFKATWTPDFMLLLADGTIELVDVKGGGGFEPATLVKVKAIAAKFWYFRIVAEQRTRGGWKRTEF